MQKLPLFLLAATLGAAGALWFTRLQEDREIEALEDWADGLRLQPPTYHLPSDLEIEEALSRGLSTAGHAIAQVSADWDDDGTLVVTIWTEQAFIGEHTVENHQEQGSAHAPGIDVAVLGTPEQVKVLPPLAHQLLRQMLSENEYMDANSVRVFDANDPDSLDDLKAFLDEMTDTKPELN